MHRPSVEEMEANIARQVESLRGLIDQDFWNFLSIAVLQDVTISREQTAALSSSDEITKLQHLYSLLSKAITEAGALISDKEFPNHPASKPEEERKNNLINIMAQANLFRPIDKLRTSA